MSNTYIFEDPSCHSCEYWIPNEGETRLRKERLGNCEHLDNDFCCGGRAKHEAGVLGGGSFITKNTFWCKFWSKK